MEFLALPMPRRSMRGEDIRSYLKCNPLANLAVTELDPIARLTRTHCRRLQRN